MESVRNYFKCWLLNNSYVARPIFNSLFLRQRWSSCHMHLLMWNGNFVYHLLRDATVLDNSINAISASLVRYCSWSPVTLVIIQVGMSKVCIKDTCRRTSERFWCLFSHLLGQLSFADEYQSMERFLLSKTESLQVLFSAPTLSL